MYIRILRYAHDMRYYYNNVHLQYGTVHGYRSRDLRPSDRKTGTFEELRYLLCTGTQIVLYVTGS